MKTKKETKFALPALAIAMLTMSATATAGDKETSAITEARQETQIWTTYALSPYLRALNLDVSVSDGKATLTGNADEDVNRELAQQIALGVKGVKEVDNQIIVQSNYVPSKSGSDRTYGEVIDDATITAAVKSKLIWSKYAEGLATDVNTESGKVTLSGTATSKNAKKHAETLAKNTQGVISIKNNLKIVEPAAGMIASTKSTIKDSGSTISDAWITTKVKSSLLYSSNVSGSSIKVITKDGVVTLSGTVNSGAEQALAVEISQNVRGVKSVKSKALTYSSDSISMK